jgi:thioredoxin reductase
MKTLKKEEEMEKEDFYFRIVEDASTFYHSSIIIEAGNYEEALKILHSKSKKEWAEEIEDWELSDDTTGNNEFFVYDDEGEVDMI